MTRYLLDSGIASDYVNRRRGVRERALQAARQGDVIGICTPVLGELIAGVLGSSDPDHHLPRLRHAVEPLRLWTYDADAANEFGRIAAELRARGAWMQAVDVQVAAIAFVLGRCTVVTKDGDFRRIPGLSVEDWSL